MSTYEPIGAVPLPQRYGISSRTTRVIKYTVGFALTALIVVNLLTTKETSLRSEPVTVTSATDGGNQNLSASSFPGAFDEITTLRGMPAEYSSRLFSGYLSIGNGGEAFYFFAESQSESPEKDPVLLWLNGGPGASSLGGCFSENGPLLVNADGHTLRVNKYAWNMNANFLCIESPVGVGFSYNVSGVYKSDDEAQAEELYGALQHYFVKFPWLRASEFIISGESYGGVYVPMTAKRIVEGNLAGEQPRINLKKFAVGNGVNEFSSLSSLVFAYYHGLIDTDQYKSIRAACPEFREFEPSPLNDISDTCSDVMAEFSTTITDTGINTYGIYNECAGSSQIDTTDLLNDLFAPSTGLPHPIGFNVGMCLDVSSKLITYFNLPEVKRDMHTKQEISRWNYLTLTSSSFDIDSLFDGNTTAAVDVKKSKILDYAVTIGMEVTSVWKFLLARDVEGVIYHGDTDMACDFIGGLWAVESLQIPRQRSRSTWSVRTEDGSEQVAGFVEDFGALKYVTIKGAGHMVPTDRPKEAMVLLDTFILTRV